MLKKILIISLAIIIFTSIKANAQYLCGSTGYIYRNQGFCNANCSLNGSSSPCEELTPSTTSAPACPSGYEGFVFNPNKNTTYAISTNSEFWTSFDNTTSSNEMAIISDSATNSLLSSILTYYNISDAWIGLYNPQMSTDYNTVNPDRPYSWVNGSSLSYTNWASGQPNNALPDQDLSLLPESEYGQHWIEMESNGNWNDIGYNYTNSSSQGYAPYLPALVQFNNQLSCVSGTEPPTPLTQGQQNNLANQYCSGNTSNCYLCTNGSNLAECQSGNTYPSGSAELCPMDEVTCNQQTNTPQYKCPSGYTLTDNTQCVNSIAPSCPAGYTFQNGQCVSTVSPSCPSGYNDVNGQCVSGQIGGSVWNTWGQELLYTAGNSIYGDNFWVGSINYNPSNNTFSGTIAYDSYWLYSNMYSGSGNSIVGDGGHWGVGGSIGYNINNNSFSGSISGGGVTVSGSGNCLVFSGYGVSSLNTICMGFNTTALTCPSGYTLQNGQCVGTASPYCSQAGYSLTNADNTCTSTISGTPTCPSGTTLQGNECVSYSCPLGNNDTCVNTGSGYYCSPYSCASYNNSSAYNLNNPNINANNPTNNGTTDPTTGECLGQIYIFSGQAMQCRDPGVQTGWGGGCCTADKKWFGLSSCNSQEKLLAQQRAADDCTMVGTYCAQSFLGYCLQTDQTWCCFPSLLANIIQQQTRAAQSLPISGWGSAQSPNCIGYTPQQFQAINFSQINLSAFYNSIEQQTSSVISNAATNAVNKFQQSLSGE
ncbi:MAG: conjugal transfer protein TraN [bacterium]